MAHNDTYDNHTTEGVATVVVSQADYAGYLFVPLLLLVGVIGNSLTIRVMLTRSFRSMPVSKTLIALSVSDTMVNLLFSFNKPFVKSLLGVDIRALSLGGCQLFFWAYRYFKTTSSWMVVLISAERFVAVWLPIKAKIINTNRNMYIAIAAIYGVLAIYIGYWCSWADQIIDGKCIPNTRPPGLELQSQVFLVVGLSLYAYIPAVILLVLNGMIVTKLIAIRRNRNKMVAPATTNSTLTVPGQPPAKEKSSATNSKTTVMLICVAVAFVVLVIPNSTSHIVSFARKQNIFETTDKGMVFFREISQIMEQLNQSINFFLYVLCSKRFRDRVVSLFGHGGIDDRADGSIMSASRVQPFSNNISDKM